MRSGPGQTSAGAARCTRCDRRGSARSSAVDSTSKSSAGGRAGRRLECQTPSGHHLHSGADVIRHRTWKRVPTGQARAVDEQRHNEPKPVVPPSGTGAGHDRDPGSSRSIPRDDRSLGRTPSTPWWRHASRDRTQESARDWQRYVGLVRCFSRRRSQRIPTPALAWSRQPPWELVPGSPLPVRPSNVAGD